MNDRLDKLLAYIGDIKVDIAVINKDIAEIKVDLARHVVRSDRLEEDNKLRAAELEGKIAPIQRHVDLVGHLIRFVMVGASIAGFLKSMGVF